MSSIETARTMASRVAGLLELLGNVPVFLVTLVAVFLAIHLVRAQRRANIAERGRDDAERGREVALKLAFMSSMSGICASASGAGCSADVARRGCPDPVATPLSVVLDGVPVVGKRVVRARWAVFCDYYEKWCGVPCSPVREIRHVQPVIRLMLEAAAGETPKHKLWHGMTASDEINMKEIAPDFCFTRLREAMLCVVAVIFAVEVKLPNNLRDAWQQAMCYGRRRVFQLVKDALDRGDAADRVKTLVAGTDGISLVVCKIDSGAPAAGQSFAGCRPCPSVYSHPALQLLPDSWTYDRRVAVRKLSAMPTPGFEALVRILSANAATLPGGDAGAPLKVLHTTTGPLHVQERLGAGGTSDVYALPGGHVAKLARAGTAGAASAFDNERCALVVLESAEVEGVPRLVEVRELERFSHVPYSSAHTPAPHHVFVMSPRGVPLATYVRCKQYSERGLREFSNALVIQLLTICRCVYAAGIVHCDVRPDNVVLDGVGSPILVDFSCCRKPGATFSQRDRDFGCDSETANEATDCVAAALLWVAVVHGGCCAPWRGSRSRELWMASNMHLPGVSKVAAYVAGVTRGSRRRRPAWRSPAV